MNRRHILGVVVLAGLSASAWAQSELARFQRQLEQIHRETQYLAREDVPPEQRALIDYGGFITFNFAAIDDQDQSTHILRQSTLNGYARVNIDGVHEFFVRGRTSYLDWNRGDSFDEHGDDLVEPTLDRGHYRFNLKRSGEAYEGRTMDGNLIIQGGRQLVHWANGITLSHEIDGAQFTVSMGSLSLQTVAGITRESSTDLDSSRPKFSSDTRRGFYGGMLGYQVSPRHQPFVYGLVQRDYNNDQTLVSDVLGTPGDATDDVSTEFDYDSHYIGAGSTGSLGDRLLYGVEAVYQGGEGLSNSFDPTSGAQLIQTREDIEAFAVDFRLDYLLTDPNRTRLGVEVVIASGDDDRFLGTTTTLGGNRPGTNDEAFNAFGLINTGLAFNPSVSNLLMLRFGASTFPMPNSSLFQNLQVGTNLFVYNKMDDNAPIDEATSNKKYLGFEPDLFVNWQVTSDLSVTMRYGVFFPSSSIATDIDPRHFVFTGITIAF